MSKQRDNDLSSVPPTSSALVERINAAIGRCEVGEGNFYKQMIEAYVSGLRNEKKLSASISAALDTMEEEFTDQLELNREPGSLTAALEFMHRDELVSPTDETLLPILGLIFTASCRREISAGRAAAAASEMLNAHKFYWEIIQIQDEWIDHIIRGPTFDDGVKSLIRRQVGQEASRESDHREILNRYVDIRKWRNDGLTDAQIRKKGTETWWTTRKKNRVRTKVGMDTSRRMVRDEKKYRSQEVSTSSADT